MFSFFSKAKAKKFMFAGLVLVLFTGLLSVSCKIDPDPDMNVPGSLPEGLLGKWVTMYDSFEIISNTGIITVEYDGGGWGDYTGTIRFVSNYTNKSGVIIIEYSDGAPDIAKKFHAIYYLDFKPDVSTELNNTSNSSEPYNADTATLNEAIAKFTQANMGNYMSFEYSTAYELVK